MSAWKTIDQPDLRGLQCPGVYVIYLDGKLTYIGSGTSVYQRLHAHLKVWRYSSIITTPWGNTPNVRVKYSLTRRRGDWAMREIRLIGRLKPIGNKTHKGVRV